jgi:DNA-binding transcriptional LysR family regulator
MAYLNNIRIFVRVMELGNLSAAGRDLRVSPAVASHRVKELEKHLGVRLFNRTTRKLTPTEQGRIFYEGACKIIEAVDAAEMAVADISKSPKGSIRVMAPLGLGKRIISPLIPLFNDLYPEIEVRLRLTDRHVDITSEGVDIAFKLGLIEDSNLRIRGIADCARILCAAPDYLQQFGIPQTIDDLIADKHRCLLLRFPGSKEYYLTLATPDGYRKVEVSGPYDTDDGDVLTEWALSGRGIINKPVFEVAAHLADGSLLPVLADHPPAAAKFACLFPHKRLQDPKVRLFIEFMSDNCKRRVAELMQPIENGPG